MLEMRCGRAAALTLGLLLSVATVPAFAQTQTIPQADTQSAVTPHKTMPMRHTTARERRAARLRRLKGSPTSAYSRNTGPGSSATGNPQSALGTPNSGVTANPKAPTTNNPSGGSN